MVSLPTLASSRQGDARTITRLSDRQISFNRGSRNGDPADQRHNSRLDRDQPVSGLENRLRRDFPMTEWLSPSRIHWVPGGAGSDRTRPHTRLPLRYGKDSARLLRFRSQTSGLSYGRMRGDRQEVGGAAKNLIFKSTVVWIRFSGQDHKNFRYSHV